MNKSVVVRKSKGERYAVRIFSLLFFVFAIICVAEMKCGKLYAALAWGIVLILLLIFEFYLGTWRISFGGKICKKTLFFLHTYEWRELAEAKKYYSLASNGEKIVMTFKNGKSLSFIGKDENAEKAEKIIVTHCNISTQ